jgi:hypothetical protein
MARLDWGAPSLFFYSADDPLCDVVKLEELIADKRRRGQRVTARRWEESEHCGHFKRHKERYSQLLLAFLDRVGGWEELNEQGEGVGASRVPRAKL